MTDKRLIGIWRSDQKKTMAEWIYAKGSTPKQKKFAYDLFGKLRLRFTQKKVYLELNGIVTSQSYRIVAKDPESVAVLYEDKATGSKTIQHIHFETDSYWISLGRCREWFLKEDRTSSSSQRRKRRG